MGINTVTVLCPLHRCKYNDVWFDGTEFKEAVRYCTKDDTIELHEQSHMFGNSFVKSTYNPRLVCMDYTIEKGEHPTEDSVSDDMDNIMEYAKDQKMKGKGTKVMFNIEDYLYEVEHDKW